MTTETMTIHRALAEINVLEDRISKLTREAVFCGAAKQSMKKLGGVTIEEYKANGQSSLDKIKDLIARLNAIKRAISESNAVTHRTVCGKDYTIAQIIWMNQHGIDFLSDLLNQMERQYSNAVSVIETTNSRLSDRADDFVIRSNNPADKDGMSPDAIRDMRDGYIERETMILIDGINIKKTKENLADEINSFKAEVDAVLSESNATTEITIEY
jgi:hypothetical protein